MQFSSGDTVAYQCAQQQVFYANNITATDNCDTSVAVSFSKGINIGNCPSNGFLLAIDYCWAAADNVGNTAEFCLVVFIIDTIPPDLSQYPADLEIDLTAGDTVPTAPTITAEDFCSGIQTVDFVEITLPDADSCGFSILRTWSAKDDCGNEISHEQTIHANDFCTNCPDSLILSLSTLPADCGLDNGQLNITVPGSVDEYAISLSPAFGSPSANGATVTGLPAGNYQVTVAHLSIPDCLNTFELTIEPDCPAPTPQTVQLDFVCGDNFLSLCANREELPGNFSAANICGAPSHGTLTMASDTCFQYQPNSDFEGIDSACLSICDDFGICDTFFFEISVEQCPAQNPCATLPSDTLIVVTDQCDNLSKLCIGLPLGQSQLYDFTVNGLPYTNNLSFCAFDTIVSYGFSAIPGNGLNGPYEITSWLVGGTNIGSGTFDNVFELVELLNMLDPNGFWVLDSLTFNISSFNNLAPYGLMTIVQTNTTDIAMLNLNTATAPIGSAIYLPVGQHEVTMQHQLTSFCVDTLTAFIHCSVPEVLFDTILVGVPETQCLSFSLPGQLNSIDLSCGACNNLNAVLTDTCVTLDGFAAGTDSVLVVACDEFGLCDSTWLVLLVMDNGLPIANIDTDSTLENTPVNIDILANDWVNGSLKTLRVLIGPQHGSASFNPDQTVNYSPEEGYCGLDAFAYEICNEIGCDTSTVEVDVHCTRPVFFTGFSPNGDGKNDFFTILNLDRYPGNELKIFNRWGTLVYRDRNYANDWDGRTIDHKQLPDGTYFFLLELAGKAPISGYFQLNR